MKKYVLKYGLIATAIMLVVGTTGMLLHDSLGMTGGMIMGYLSMILAFAMIFIAIRQYRDQELKGKISFGKAFMVGLYISLIVSSVYVLGWMMYYDPSSSNFMEEWKEFTVQSMEEAGSTPEEIQAAIAELDQSAVQYNSSPLYRIFATLMEILPVGIFISLIAAAILFKKKSEQPELYEDQ